MTKPVLMLFLTLTLLCAACAELSSEGRATMRQSLADKEQMLDLLLRLELISPSEYSAELQRIGSARHELDRDETKAGWDRWIDVGLAGLIAAGGLKGAGPAVRGVVKVGKAMKNAASKGTQPKAPA